MGLSIDIWVLATQIFNFLIIVFLLQRFLYKPVLSMLDKRKREIEKGIELTTKLAQEQEKLDTRKKKIVKEAQEEGQRIISEAIIQAKKEEERIITEAKKAALLEYEKMKQLNAREREKTLDEAREQALTYAISISEKLLSEKLSQEEQKRLLEKSIQELSRA